MATPFTYETTFLVGGYTTSPTNVSLVKNGDVVNIHIDSLSWTQTTPSGPAVSTVPIPHEYQPSSRREYPVVIASGNTRTVGLLNVQTTGVLLIFPSVDPAVTGIINGWTSLDETYVQ